MDGFVLETERLVLRKMNEGDLESLGLFLSDKEVMYAYEHAFSSEEVKNWLDRQLERYEKDGFGLWAVVLKESGEMIGDCGLTIQDADGERLLEIGYHLRKKFWHKGYATEAAEACKKYAFETLGAPIVCSIIRDNNFPSRKVAERNGMTVGKSFVKHYYGMDMPHLVYFAENDLKRNENND